MYGEERIALGLVVCAVLLALLACSCGDVTAAAVDVDAGHDQADDVSGRGGAGGGAIGADAGHDQAGADAAPSEAAAGSGGSNGGAGGAGGGAPACAIVEGFACSCGGDCGTCPTPDSYTPCPAPRDWQARGCKLGGVPFVGCRRAPDGSTLVCVAECA